jgi:NAD+ kinase
MREGYGRSWAMAERMDPLAVRRVAVVAKPGVSEGYFERLVAMLGKRGVEISEVRHDDEPDGAAEPDLVFVLGGDGTMLKASRMYPGRVLLGVNLGKVGFMSGMVPEEIETGVEKVWDGGLEVQEYRMLEVRVSGEEARLAANDAVLIKRRPHQLISVDVEVSGEELFAFRCDGFIAATPLGSTAYALSAGGPIISGDAGCYVLVPIAPHALVSRPLVLGEDQVAELKLVDRDALLSLDGDDPREIPAGGRVEIRLSKESVKIGRTEDWSWWRAVRRTFL